MSIYKHAKSNVLRGKLASARKVAALAKRPEDRERARGMVEGICRELDARGLAR